MKPERALFLSGSEDEKELRPIDGKQFQKRENDECDFLFNRAKRQIGPASLLNNVRPMKIDWQKWLRKTDEQGFLNREYEQLQKVLSIVAIVFVLALFAYLFFALGSPAS